MNVRSLNSHAVDLLKFPSIAFADAVFLTETQLNPSDDLIEIQNTLKDLKILFCNYEDKFSSLACCYLKGGFTLRCESMIKGAMKFCFAKSNS